MTKLPIGTQVDRAIQGIETKHPNQYVDEPITDGKPGISQSELEQVVDEAKRDGLISREEKAALEKAKASLETAESHARPAADRPSMATLREMHALLANPLQDVGQVLDGARFRIDELLAAASRKTGDRDLKTIHRVLEGLQTVVEYTGTSVSDVERSDARSMIARLHVSNALYELSHGGRPTPASIRNTKRAIDATLADDGLNPARRVDVRYLSNDLMMALAAIADAGAAAYGNPAELRSGVTRTLEAIIDDAGAGELLLHAEHLVTFDATSAERTDARAEWVIAGLRFVVESSSTNPAQKDLTAELLGRLQEDVTGRWVQTIGSDLRRPESRAGDIGALAPDNEPLTAVQVTQGLALIDRIMGSSAANTESRSAALVNSGFVKMAVASYGARGRQSRGTDLETLRRSGLQDIQAAIDLGLGDYGNYLIGKALAIDWMLSPWEQALLKQAAGQGEHGTDTLWQTGASLYLASSDQLISGMRLSAELTSIVLTTDLEQRGAQLTQFLHDLDGAAEQGDLVAKQFLFTLIAKRDDRSYFGFNSDSMTLNYRRDDSVPRNRAIAAALDAIDLEAIFPNGSQPRAEALAQMLLDEVDSYFLANSSLVPDWLISRATETGDTALAKLATEKYLDGFDQTIGALGYHVSVLRQIGDALSGADAQAAMLRWAQQVKDHSASDPTLKDQYMAMLGSYRSSSYAFDKLSPAAQATLNEVYDHIGGLKIERQREAAGHIDTAISRVEGATKELDELQSDASVNVWMRLIRHVGFAAESLREDTMRAVVDTATPEKKEELAQALRDLGRAARKLNGARMRVGLMAQLLTGDYLTQKAYELERSLTEIYIIATRDFDVAFPPLRVVP